MADQKNQTENPVQKLRERFNRIKENRKPSKAVEETFISPPQKEKGEKKIARPAPNEKDSLR